MTTRDNIIATADKFIREDGYNAFSYKDIAQKVGIRTASVHYYFPTKTDLGVAVIRYHIQLFEEVKEKMATEPPLAKLNWLLNNYHKINAENKVCLVGALATAFNTVEAPIQQELKIFANDLLKWVTHFLEEGKQLGIYNFALPARTQAIMTIGNMLAVVQLARLTDNADVQRVQEAIIQELTKQPI